MNIECSKAKIFLSKVGTAVVDGSSIKKIPPQEEHNSRLVRSAIP